MKLNFTVIIDDAPESATLVLAVSNDLQSFLIANPEGGMRVVPIHQCKLGNVYFDTNMLNWSSAFLKPTDH